MSDKPKCGACGMEIDRDSGIAYCGTYVRHNNRSDCISPLKARIAELERQLAEAAEAESSDLFVIQDSRSYVGNSVLWWAVDGGGYTCELDKAWKVPREKAEGICRDRSTDVMWPLALVSGLAQKHVDIQHLHAAEDATREGEKR